MGIDLEGFQLLDNVLRKKSLDWMLHICKMLVSNGGCLKTNNWQIQTGESADSL